MKNKNLSFKRFANWADFPVVGKGSNGRNLCRWCQKEVPPKRKTVCSSECENELNIRTSSSYARRQVRKRDKHVCSNCGVNTDRLRKVIIKLCDRFYIRQTGKEPYNTHEVRKKYEKQFDGFLKYFLDKYKWFKYSGHLWEMDHIVPVYKGGGSCGLDNLTTLCLGCHKEKTKKDLK